MKKSPFAKEVLKKSLDKKKVSLPSSP